jgi:hypothetical protein
METGVRKVDWRVCEHEFYRKEPGNFSTTKSYQWQCVNCGIYSYAGPLYKKLNHKSIFITG